MTQRVGVAPFVLITLFSVCAFSQSLPDIGTVKDLPATESPSPKYQRISPIVVNPQSGLVRGAAASTIQPGAFGLPFGRANIISTPNFNASFISRGKTWQLTMMGTAPWDGGSTSIPAKIVAVSLRLQNANLVTFTNVSVAPFLTPMLNSPNFQRANYSTGAGDPVWRRRATCRIFSHDESRLAYQCAACCRGAQHHHYGAALHDR